MLSCQKVYSFKAYIRIIFVEILLNNQYSGISFLENRIYHIISSLSNLLLSLHGIEESFFSLQFSHLMKILWKEKT